MYDNYLRFMMDNYYNNNVYVCPSRRVNSLKTCKYLLYIMTHKLSFRVVLPVMQLIVIDYKMRKLNKKK